MRKVLLAVLIIVISSVCYAETKVQGYTDSSMLSKPTLKAIEFNTGTSTKIFNCPVCEKEIYAKFMGVYCTEVSSGTTWSIQFDTFIHESCYEKFWEFLLDLYKNQKHLIYYP